MRYVHSHRGPSQALAHTVSTRRAAHLHARVCIAPASARCHASAPACVWISRRCFPLHVHPRTHPKRCLPPHRCVSQGAVVWGGSLAHDGAQLAISSPNGVRLACSASRALLADADGIVHLSADLSATGGGGAGSRRPLKAATASSVGPSTVIAPPLGHRFVEVGGGGGGGNGGLYAALSSTGDVFVFGDAAAEPLLLPALVSRVATFSGGPSHLIALDHAGQVARLSSALQASAASAALPLLPQAADGVAIERMLCASLRGAPTLQVSVGGGGHVAAIIADDPPLHRPPPPPLPPLSPSAPLSPSPLALSPASRAMQPSTLSYAPSDGLAAASTRLAAGDAAAAAAAAAADVSYGAPDACMGAPGARAGAEHNCAAGIAPSAAPDWSGVGGGPTQHRPSTASMVESWPGTAGAPAAASLGDARPAVAVPSPTALAAASLAAAARAAEAAAEAEAAAAVQASAAAPPDVHLARALSFGVGVTGGAPHANGSGVGGLGLTPVREAPAVGHCAPPLRTPYHAGSSAAAHAARGGYNSFPACPGWEGGAAADWPPARGSALPAHSAYGGHGGHGGHGGGHGDVGALGGTPGTRGPLPPAGGGDGGSRASDLQRSLAEALQLSNALRGQLHTQLSQAEAEEAHAQAVAQAQMAAEADARRRAEVAALAAARAEAEAAVAAEVAAAEVASRHAAEEARAATSAAVAQAVAEAVAETIARKEAEEAQRREAIAQAEAAATEAAAREQASAAAAAAAAVAEAEARAAEAAREAKIEGAAAAAAAAADTAARAEREAAAAAAALREATERAAALAAEREAERGRVAELEALLQAERRQEAERARQWHLAMERERATEERRRSDAEAAEAVEAAERRASAAAGELMAVAEEERLESLMISALAALRHRGLRRGLLGWLGSVRARLEQLGTMRAVVFALRSRKLRCGCNSWVGWWRERVAALAGPRRAFAHWRGAKVGRALNSWAAHVEMRRRLRRAAASVRHSKRRAAFNSWVCLGLEAETARTRLATAARRFSAEGRAMGRALNAWKGRRPEWRLLRKGAAALRQNAAYRAVRKWAAVLHSVARLRVALRRLRHRALGRALRSWTGSLTHLRSLAYTTPAPRRALSRLAHRPLSRAFHQWVVVQATAYGLARAVSHLIHRGLSRGWHSWDSYCADRQLMAYGLSSLRDASLRRGLNTWCAWYDTATRRRARMAGCVRALTSRLQAALNTWVAFRRPGRAEHALRHLMRRGLSRGWRSWRWWWAARTAALRGLRRAVAALRNRGLRRGMLTWDAYALARAEALRTLRAGVQAARDGRRRRAWNQWEAACASAQRQHVALRRLHSQQRVRALNQWVAYRAQRRRYRRAAAGFTHYAVLVAVRTWAYHAEEARRALKTRTRYARRVLAGQGALRALNSWREAGASRRLLRSACAALAHSKRRAALNTWAERVADGAECRRRVGAAISRFSPAGRARARALDSWRTLRRRRLAIRRACIALIQGQTARAYRCWTETALERAQTRARLAAVLHTLSPEGRAKRRALNQLGAQLAQTRRLRTTIGRLRASRVVRALNGWLHWGELRAMARRVLCAARHGALKRALLTWRGVPVPPARLVLARWLDRRASSVCRRAWAQLRIATGARARQLVAQALARGHERGRLVYSAFGGWRSRWRARHMRRCLAAAAHPHQVALLYALGRLGLNAHIVRTASSRTRAARRHHGRRWLRRWRQKFSSVAVRKTLVATGVFYEMSSGARRGFLALAIHAQRRLSHQRAIAVQHRRTRRVAFQFWRASLRMARTVGMLGGDSTRLSRTSRKRRGLAAFRARIAAVRAARIFAAHTASGRHQMHQLALARACSTLRAHAAHRARARQTALVASQRGITRRATALLQPLRGLMLLKFAHALQCWRAFLFVLAMERRLKGLEAALEAEQRLKRRQHAAQLQQSARAPPSPLPSAGSLQPRRPPPARPRSALDKLFAVLEVWEAKRLRPALLAWRRASLAMPMAPVRPERARALLYNRQGF